jgi:glycerol uptake facilitator-like aquaporin
MMTKKPILSGQRKYAAEFLGSCLLTMVVIGSGIAAQQLSPDQVGFQLLENSIVTGAGLFALISLFPTVSGAHFNPVVTLSAAALNGMSWREVPGYCLSQVAGCIFGAVVANYMFSLPLVTWSQHHRINGPHFVSEIVATAGLLLVIFGLTRSGKSSTTPAGVATYITAAYFFTSSTSFANPAITIGRMFSNSFAGIAPSSVPGFIGAQLLGMALAIALVTYLWPSPQ